MYVHRPERQNKLRIIITEKRALLLYLNDKQIFINLPFIPIIEKLFSLAFKTGENCTIILNLFI